MVLPDFTTTGSPEFISNSCGVIAGLYLGTERGEILKGLIESMTFYLRECLVSLPEGLDITDFRAAGGGSKSDTWLQISTDILGHPFLRPKVNEAVALGTAILARFGSSIFPSISAGVDLMVKSRKTFYPDPTIQQLYNEHFEKYHLYGL
jgi:xylulokinase